MSVVLDALGLVKTYETDPPVHALRHVDIQVRAGERVAVVGQSGSGKSTLLNILGLLDEPSAGTYELAGTPVAAVGQSHRDRMRARTLGFVFQDAHVLGHRTVYDNLTLALAITRVPRSERSRLITAALHRVGLDHRERALGRLLSGGEKQRLAIARALITRPAVLLADEPTGNLDETNTATVLRLFDEAAADGVAIVVITHDRNVAHWADRSLLLHEGTLTAPRPGEAADALGEAPVPGTPNLAGAQECP